MKRITFYVFSVLLLFIFVIVFCLLYKNNKLGLKQNRQIDSTPQQMTIRGTYICLPLLDSTKKSETCVFGIQSNTGELYAVNFGASQNAMKQFQDRAHVSINGFFVPKEALKY